MAKFRQNHQKGSRRGSSSGGFFYGKLVMFTVVLVTLLLGGTKMLSNFELDDLGGGGERSSVVDGKERFYLPTSTTGNVVHHKYYSLSYNDRHELPEWVAYELTAADLKVKNVKRAKRFLYDEGVKGNSAKHGDYINSGYTRGHMAPAGDMAFDTDAMRESFFMSNMAPQVRVFNNGIWKELEEQGRDWAYDDKRLYVVTGPVVKDIKTWIGKSEVGVPKLFYKIYLDLEGSEQKAIAFIIPHGKSDKHLTEFAVTIDEVEQVTGLDFFGELMEDDLERKLESEVDVDDWEFDKKRFRARVEKWNNQ